MKIHKLAAVVLWLTLPITAFHPAAEAWAQSGALPGAVERVRAAFRIPESALGIVVRELGSDRALVSVNADVPRNPASAIKVLPTLAALEELGPAHTWSTEVYRGGNVRNGVLHGNLYLKGSGDPHLVTEEVWKLVQALRRQGLKSIEGDLVIDSSRFVVPEEDPGAFDNRPFHAYNALPNALLVNYQAAYFYFHAAGSSDRVTILMDPALPNLTVDNRLRTHGGRCGGYQRGIAVSVPDPAVADRIVFEGQYPRACGTYVMSRSVLRPETFAYGVFKSLWEQSGGAISGGVRSAAVPSSARRILLWRSQPLGDTIRLVNKYSNNVMTRNLLLTLAAELIEEPGTVENGRHAIRQYLEQRGIDADSLVLVNGAGLSRDTRVSPQLLVDLLQYAYTIPFMPEFMSSLSIIGIDGTAKSRLHRRGEAGNAHVKTGTIDHVSAITGYVHARSGRRFAIAGIVNHPEVHRGPGTQMWNALVQWTFDQ